MMLDWQGLIGKIAGIISLLGYLPLIISILSRQTRPSRITWIIWSILNIITATSYYASGARTTAWVPVGYAIGTPIVAILAIFYYGEGGWSRLDRWCLAVSALSGVAWWLFKTPAIALLMNLVIGNVATLPTIRKVYHDPNSESKLVWSIFFIGGALNVLAIKNWQFVIIIYPVLVGTVNGVVTLLLWWSRRTIKKALPGLSRRRQR